MLRDAALTVAAVAIGGLRALRLLREPSLTVAAVATGGLLALGAPDTSVARVLRCVVAVAAALAIHAAFASVARHPFLTRIRGAARRAAPYVAFATWGPALVLAGYAVTAGVPSGVAWAASVPTGLLAAVAVVARDLDSLARDAAEVQRTVVVAMGPRQARRLAAGLSAAFYPYVGILVGAGALPVWVATTVVALPFLERALALLRHPKPYEQPPQAAAWPAWFAPLVVDHARVAAVALAAGLLVGAIWPVALS